MTPEVEHTSQASSKPAMGGSRVRSRPAGHTEFEALLGLQMLSKMPEAGGSERAKEQIKAQDRRGDERTGRAQAQQELKGNGRERAGSRDAGRNSAGTHTVTESPARAGAASTSTSTSGVRGGTGNESGSSSFPLAKPAQAALGDAQSTAKPAPDTDGGDANASHRSKSNAFGSLINAQTPARSASVSGRTVEAVSSVKAVGSSGAQHGGLAARSGGRRATIARGRPNAPASQSKAFHLEQQKVLAQAGRGLAAALKQEGGVVTLRLRPESLGELKIKVELSQGRISAVFRADNDSARQLLESSIDALKSSLEAKGLRVDRLHVQLPDDSGAKQQSGSPSEPNDRGQTPGGDREATDDGDRPRHSPGMAHDEAGSSPPADAEASVDQTAVSDARIAKDSTLVSGLDPGEDEILVRVRLDAVA